MAKCSGKPVPTNRALYARVKAAAKRKFPTYPSIYANSWLVSEYKRRGGKYRCTTGKGGGLTKWYKEKWVDLSRPLVGGGWAQCGRSEVERDWKREFPKCVPLARARRMTKAQRESAVRRKRKAVSRSRRGKPTYVKTVKNPAGGLASFGWLLAGAAVAVLLLRRPVT